MLFYAAENDGQNGSIGFVFHERRKGTIVYAHHVQYKYQS
jgi:hypothetical protein